MSIPLNAVSVTQVVAAIGALGTAASGIVDASKTSLKPINRIGLSHITETVKGFMPETRGPNAPADGLNSLKRQLVLDSLEANWINGADLNSQKASAKLLIHNHLIEGNAEVVAQCTNVDSATLKSIAAKTLSGAPLEIEEQALKTRFEVILDTLIDAAYQKADERYRNWTRSLAAGIAVLLALTGGGLLQGREFLHSQNVGLALMVGLLAIPLAPIAKNVANALSAYADSLQAVKTPAKGQSQN
jgi:hypothetical protein